MGVGLLRNDIASLDSRFTLDQLDITLIRPLLKLVVNWKSDAEVWAALYDLVLQASLTHPRPDRPSIASLVQGTPNSYQSGSFQNMSMPVEEVKKALKCEPNSSFELNNPNFIATIFAKDRQVADAADAVFNKCCEGEAPKFLKRWHGWEDHMEPDVQRSFENLIKFIMTLLDSANIKPPSKRQFVPSPNTKLLGTVKLKPDICLANGTDRPSWGQVLVPIELKAPGRDGWEGTGLDIAKYARAILSHQDSRRFVLGMTLCGSTMRL